NDVRRKTRDHLPEVGREGERDDAHRDQVLAEIAAAGDEAERRVIEVPGPGEGATFGRVVHAQLRSADPCCQGDAAAQQDRDEDAAPGGLGRRAEGGEDADADHHSRREERGSEWPELPFETATSRATHHRQTRSAQGYKRSSKRVSLGSPEGSSPGETGTDLECAA